MLNNTRVLPARLYGTREDTGAVVEFVLLRQHGNKLWECLAGPGKKAKTGYKFKFSDKLTATVTDVLEDGNRMLEFACEGDFFAVLDGVGQMPLPPYIKEKLNGSRNATRRYIQRTQALPPRLPRGCTLQRKCLKISRHMGVNIAYVTLHVGLGTFRPVKVEDVTQHKMHTEHYYIPEETAKIINETRKNGGRVICVGTTSLPYALKACAKNTARCKSARDDTDIFIYPGL